MGPKDWVELAVQAGTLVALLAAGYLAFRRWVQRVGADAREAAAQLKTRNGTTVAGYVEHVVDEVAHLRGEIATLTARTTENRDLAVGAHALAQATSDRLDAHLKGHN